MSSPSLHLQQPLVCSPSQGSARGHLDGGFSLQPSVVQFCNLLHWFPLKGVPQAALQETPSQLPGTCKFKIAIRIITAYGRWHLGFNIHFEQWILVYCHGRGVSAHVSLISSMALLRLLRRLLSSIQMDYSVVAISLHTENNACIATVPLGPSFTTTTYRQVVPSSHYRDCSLPDDHH